MLLKEFFTEQEYKKEIVEYLNQIFPGAYFNDDKRMFIKHSQIYKIFTNAYNNRHIRHDNKQYFYNDFRQLIAKYLPELHIKTSTIAASELEKLLDNSGFKIISKTDSTLTGKNTGTSK
ncbi:MAG: hypothetical protein E7Y34_02605, partial [Mycoplasma sp.]|nr:hypothetical protein [Mycoplasma sp.]